jgi:hypothetical protein
MKTNRWMVLALSTVLVVQLIPLRVQAQAQAVVVPVGAAIVVILGISYYVWQAQGVERRVPVVDAILEDPEDEGEWGEFKAGDYRKCQRLAAGRDWYWEDGKCFIKV